MRIPAHLGLAALLLLPFSAYAQQPSASPMPGASDPVGNPGVTPATPSDPGAKPSDPGAKPSRSKR